MMDPDETAGEAPGVPEGRNSAFSTGLSGTGQRFNSMVPPGFAQHSVLQQSLPSANGMSAQDYERILPGMDKGGRPVILPSQNGTSQNNWEKTTWMRLAGRNVI
jgi:hypothetical protein